MVIDMARGDRKPDPKQQLDSWLTGKGQVVCAGIVLLIAVGVLLSLFGVI